MYTEPKKKHNFFNLNYYHVNNELNANLFSNSISNF